jgi:hypothetical protein
MSAVEEAPTAVAEEEAAAVVLFLTEGVTGGFVAVFERQQEMVQGRPAYMNFGGSSSIWGRDLSGVRGRPEFLYFSTDPSAGDCWRVSETMGSDTSQWKVLSSAMTPENITEPWSTKTIDTGGVWVEVPAAKIVRDGYLDFYGYVHAPKASECTTKAYAINPNTWSQQEAAKRACAMRSCHRMRSCQAILGLEFMFRNIICRGAPGASPLPSYADRALVLTDVGVRGFTSHGLPTAMTWDAFSMDGVTIVGEQRSDCCHPGAPDESSALDARCSAGIGIILPCAHVDCMQGAAPGYFRVVIRSTSTHTGSGGFGVVPDREIMGWALAAEPGALLDDLRAGFAAAQPRLPPYSDRHGKRHLPLASERTTHQLGLDHGQWARYQRERAKPVMRYLEATGGEEADCVLPWCVINLPIKVLSYILLPPWLLCVGAKEAPLPPWHARALVFTDTGVRGRNSSGFPTAIRWDAVDVETGVQIHRPERAPGCCRFADGNDCDPQHHGWRNHGSKDLACNVGVGLLLPCCMVKCRQQTLPGFYRLIIHSQGNAGERHAIEVLGLPEGTEDTVMRLLADGVASYQPPAPKEDAEEGAPAPAPAPTPALAPAPAPADSSSLMLSPAPAFSAGSIMMVTRVASTTDELDGAPHRNHIERGVSSMVEPARQQKGGSPCTIM